MTVPNVKPYIVGEVVASLNGHESWLDGLTDRERIQLVVAAGRLIQMVRMTAPRSVALGGAGALEIILSLHRFTGESMYQLAGG